MTPQDRLDQILREERFRAFAPFGAADPGSSGTPCLCFSECPPGHLDHLITMRGFTPWGLVTIREVVNSIGGGAVAYVPPDVHKAFRKARLGHWAVRTAAGSTWLHEREWRVPLPDGEIGIKGMKAILIADAQWRPTTVPTGRWVEGDTGIEVPGPGAPNAVEFHDYPRLWRESKVWVWDWKKHDFAKYEAGELR
ncbi:hypothetical protein E4N62_12620 [Streptomyces sp. MNU76]|uniref:hypothetical protein n=1 Tax=Streptomyces sp. MNU76 TaxID=2560026 RepID=UPI001E5F0B8D|nr:hypothetical protein [Streptomyces sp. MNU76]MCC9706026.1 hypothetical protein [Streptomyces sp. MNU76]